MHRILILSFFSCFCLFGFSQNFVKHSNVQPSHQWKVNLSEIDELQIVQLKQKEAAPRPASNVDDIKAKLDAQRKKNENFANKSTSYVTTSDDVLPTVIESFNGESHIQIAWLCVTVMTV